MLCHLRRVILKLCNHFPIQVISLSRNQDIMYLENEMYQLFRNLRIRFLTNVLPIFVNIR